MFIARFNFTFIYLLIFNCLSCIEKPLFLNNSTVNTEVFWSLTLFWVNIDIWAQASGSNMIRTWNFTAIRKYRVDVLLFDRVRMTCFEFYYVQRHEVIVLNNIITCQDNILISVEYVSHIVKRKHINFHDLYDLILRNLHKLANLIDFIINHGV